MDRRAWYATVLFLIAVGCGGDPGAPAGTDAESAPTSEAMEPSEAPQPSEGPQPSDAVEVGTVAVADSDLGSILVDAEGITLYRFDNDTDGESTCYDDCEANWPPLLIEGDSPAAGEGADESLLGTTERTDGTVQVTYAGQPLYYFAGDEAAGDVNGQAVGDIWWVVAADGAAIKTANEQPPAAG